MRLFRRRAPEQQRAAKKPMQPIPASKKPQRQQAKEKPLRPPQAAQEKKKAQGPSPAKRRRFPLPLFRSSLAAQEKTAMSAAPPSQQLSRQGRREEGMQQERPVPPRQRRAQPPPELQNIPPVPEKPPNRVEQIHAIVQDLYLKGPAPWFFQFHVLPTVEYARSIAKREGYNSELCVAAAYLHDVAYAWGIMEELELMGESLSTARKILTGLGYSTTDIVKVHRAIDEHACHVGFPSTPEGKALATADALAHLMTDFFFSLPFHLPARSSDFETFRAWITEKIDRDFNRKIRFPQDRTLARARYGALKALFPRGRGRAPSHL